jgi:hypothetical protein
MGDGCSSPRRKIRLGKSHSILFATAIFASSAVLGGSQATESAGGWIQRSDAFAARLIQLEQRLRPETAVSNPELDDQVSGFQYRFPCSSDGGISPASRRVRSSARAREGPGRATGPWELFGVWFKHSPDRRNDAAAPRLKLSKALFLDNKLDNSNKSPA